MEDIILFLLHLNSSIHTNKLILERIRKTFLTMHIWMYFAHVELILQLLSLNFEIVYTSK